MKTDHLKRAVEMSKKSAELGYFPAGAVLVKDGGVVAESTSSPYLKKHMHAETILVDQEMERTGKLLTGYELYTSVESCFMCLGKIYWSEISKIYYVLGRKDVDASLSYEGDFDSSEIYSKLNGDVEFIQVDDYRDEAMAIYLEWEKRIKALEKSNE